MLAHGLLSTRLESAEYHVRDFAWFEALTGITTPRLGEIERSDAIASESPTSNEPGLRRTRHGGRRAPRTADQCVGAPEAVSTNAGDDQ